MDQNIINDIMDLVVQMYELDCKANNGHPINAPYSVGGLKGRIRNREDGSIAIDLIQPETHLGCRDVKFPETPAVDSDDVRHLNAKMKKYS